MTTLDDTTGAGETARCQACGALVAPDETVDAQDRGPDDTQGVNLGFRRARCCETCFDAMGTDMWTCRAAWERLSPRVPFDQLPDLP